MFDFISIAESHGGPNENDALDVAVTTLQKIVDATPNASPLLNLRIKDAILDLECARKSIVENEALSFDGEEVTQELLNDASAELKLLRMTVEVLVDSVGAFAGMMHSERVDHSSEILQGAIDGGAIELVHLFCRDVADNIKKSTTVAQDAVDSLVSRICDAHHVSPFRQKAISRAMYREDSPEEDRAEHIKEFLAATVFKAQQQPAQPEPTADPLPEPTADPLPEPQPYVVPDCMRAPKPKSLARARVAPRYKSPEKIAQLNVRQTLQYAATLIAWAAYCERVENQPEFLQACVQIKRFIAVSPWLQRNDANPSFKHVTFSRNLTQKQKRYGSPGSYVVESEFFAIELDAQNAKRGA